MHTGYLQEIFTSSPYNITFALCGEGTFMYNAFIRKYLTECTCVVSMYRCDIQLGIHFESSIYIDSQVDQ